ncbi:MAG: hypothetical protein QOF50_367 [Gaiellaceae bacterium]|nr:hypothetical protein [Gaiellaceae bacterium]
MRKTMTTLLATLALAVPTADAWAAVRSATATPKKKVVVISRKFVGPAAQTDRWGYTQVTIVVRKTTTTIGTKKTVKRRITSVSATTPNHTDRSVRINEQAIPILRQETLSAQSARILIVSGATDTSYAFGQSLQAAILAAHRA